MINEETVTFNLILLNMHTREHHLYPINMYDFYVIANKFEKILGFKLI